MAKIPNVEKLAAVQQSQEQQQSSGPFWPELGDAAFYGLAGRIVRKIEPHSEADPAGMLLQFLVLFGNMIGRSAHFTVEADEHYTNLFAILVGETSIGRKGVSLNQVKSQLAKVDSEWSSERFLTGLSSGEGVIHAVRDPVDKQVPGENGPETVVVDEGVADKRLMLIETEFASVLKVLKRDGNILSSILRSAWDGGNLQTLTKNSPTRATSPHISIIGHVTKSDLTRHLDSTDASNGFGNRFLWCCVKRSKELPEGGADKYLDFENEIAQLKSVADSAGKFGRLDRDDEARKLWSANYKRLTQGFTGLFGSIITRAAPQVMRLACIYALLDGDVMIKGRHLEAALTLWRYCEDSVRWIFGEAVGHPVADEILRFLQQSPAGATKTQISGLFGGHKVQKTIDEALESLKADGRVTSGKKAGAGRPTEVWRAT